MQTSWHIKIKHFNKIKDKINVILRVNLISFSQKNYYSYRSSLTLLKNKTNNKKHSTIFT